MFIVREVMHCKPGKVRDLVARFKTVSDESKKMGYKGFRLSTDVVAEQFWTVVAESEAESLNQFFESEQAMMANEAIKKAMTGYHDLVERGRREIFRVEN
jgi:hypothetical protein